MNHQKPMLQYERKLGPVHYARRGTAALEEVMVLGIMLPLVFGAFVLTRMMCVYVYQIISSLVGWPYL